jgi:hypothetical protein
MAEFIVPEVRSLPFMELVVNQVARDGQLDTTVVCRCKGSDETPVAPCHAPYPGARVDIALTLGGDEEPRAEFKSRHRFCHPNGPSECENRQTFLNNSNSNHHFHP